MRGICGESLASHQRWGNPLGQRSFVSVALFREQEKTDLSRKERSQVGSSAMRVSQSMASSCHVRYLINSFIPLILLKGIYRPVENMSLKP